MCINYSIGKVADPIFFKSVTVINGSISKDD